MILLLLIFYILFLTCFNFLLYFSLKKLFGANFSNKEITSGISVVVALRNEEANIKMLIHNLEMLDYPLHCFEVILVDDNSTDGTLETLERITSGKNNFRVIEAKNKTLPAKKGALAVGIENSKFDYIMITDADCLPSVQWLNSFNVMFRQSYDFVFGITVCFQTVNYINRISCFENVRSAILKFGLAGLNLPYTAGAASFGFRKESFIKIGGYKNTTDTISGDDDLLIREAVKNNLKIGTVINPEAFVYTKTKSGLTDYLNQKSRHTSTSFYYLPRHKITLAVWHLFNLVSLPVFIAAFISPVLFLIPAVKFFLDLLMIKSFQKKFGYNFKMKDIIFFQTCYEILLVVNFFNGLRKKTDWK